jgi:tripartite-type tricarboxylate transporter receptor subunit TctC
MDEVGIPLEGGTVQTGLYSPAGTPPTAISRLNSELVRIIATPEYQNMLSRFGTIPVSSSAEGFDRQLREQSKKWTELKVRMKLEAQ